MEDEIDADTELISPDECSKLLYLALMAKKFTENYHSSQTGSRIFSRLIAKLYTTNAQDAIAYLNAFFADEL